MRFHRHSVSFRSSETGGFQVELWNCSLVERLPVRFWLKRSTRFTRKALWHPRYCRRLGPHGRPVPQGGHPEIEIFKTRKNMSLHHRHMMTHDLPQQVDFCVFFAMLSTLLSPEMLHQHQPQEDGSWQQRPTYQWSGATRFSLRPPVDFGIPKLHGSYSFHVTIWNYFIRQRPQCTMMQQPLLQWSWGLFVRTCTCGTIMPNQFHKKTWSKLIKYQMCPDSLAGDGCTLLTGLVSLLLRPWHDLVFLQCFLSPFVRWLWIRRTSFL